MPIPLLSLSFRKRWVSACAAVSSAVSSILWLHEDWANACSGFLLLVSIVRGLQKK